MKQNITEEQLAELTEKQKEKLREFLTGLSHKEAKLKTFKIAKAKTYIVDSASNAQAFYREYLRIPLLSIGQMVEFLHSQDMGCLFIGCDDKWLISFGKHNELPKDEETKSSKELCDALWEAVKEVLSV